MLKIYDFITSKYRIVLPVVWTIVLLAFYFTGTFIDRRNLIQEARINAAASFEKDIVYRRWNAEHGSVYVPVTEKNPPNPFLSVTDKIVTTENGKKLTLINPAYMIRQVHDLAREAYGIRGHITSLNPIRPRNAPDPWEAAALYSFGQGKKEIYSEDVIEGRPYLRFMRPLITEKGCLRCHEEQGYKEGDIRGGISISVPLEPYFSIHSNRVKFSLWVFVLIWIAGIGSFFSGTNRIKKLNKIRAEVDKKRRQAEDKALQQNYLLVRTQELGRIGSWELDLPDNNLYWTDENYRIFGVPEGSAVDYEMFIEKVHPDDREYVYQEWKAALKGKPFNIVHRLFVDGSIKWVREKADVEFDENGEALRAIGFTQDITAPKQAEKALKESEERYKEFVEGTSDLIMRVDGDIRLTYVNNISTEVFGIPPGDCIGMSAFDFIHPEDRKLTRDWIEDTVSSQKPYATIENRLVSKKGGVRRMFWNCRFRYNDWCKLKEINGIARDITEHKQMETLILESKKMEGIGRLAGGMAYDFNSILSPVLLHSEIVMDDLAPDNPLQHSMREINKAGKRARDLVREISFLAGEGFEEKILLNSSLVINNAVKLLRSSSQADIDIQFNNKAEQDRILASPAQLSRIVTSLCTNAVHSMREKGGLLDITLDNEDISVEKVSSLFNLKPGRYLKISIRDTGPVMSRDTLNRLFEPYSSTGQNGGIAGPGLSIIHGIVKSHGGAITADNGLRKGKIFHVYLPLVEIESHGMDEQKKVLLRGIERILYVDDEVSSGAAMEMMFERLGYKATVMSGSMDTLKAFRNDHERFDLVILNMIMPDMNGVELAGKLKATRPDMPVILCAEFDGQIDQKTAAEMGIDAVIIKPIIGSEIADIIRKVLDAE